MLAADLTPASLNTLIASLPPKKRKEAMVLALALLASPKPKSYKFRGANAQALEMRQEFILSGPSNTGKTIACLALLDKMARAYPGSQLAIVRKIQADLEATVIQTFKEKILHNDPEVSVMGGGRADWFQYPNGSRIWCTGMDKFGKVLSSDRDCVYVNQSEELSAGDWETLTTRTTGRAGHTPFAFTFGDANPRGSSHWILQRAQAGSLKLLVSRHVDNPALFDSSGAMTPLGSVTLEKLSALTGLRRKRLFEGLWAQAEGMVYADWEQSTHVLVRDMGEFPIIVLCADDGYTNPACLYWVGIDADVRLHVLAEWYETQKLHSEIAKEASSMRFGRLPNVVVVDAAAAGLVGAMQALGLPALGHKGRVLDSINLVADLLRVRGDGRPRLTVDPGCTHFIAEIEEYSWASGSKEQPALGQADHAMTALYYLAHYLFAPKDGERVQVVYNPVNIESRF